jgi:hypothetical protein
MLTAVAAPIDETAYWGTVAQIVPVFALTLVLEARRMAGTWAQRDRVDRVLTSTQLILVGALLFFTEILALSSLAQHTSSPGLVGNAELILIITMALLVMNPLGYLLVIGNVELWLIALRLLPGSKWRKLRRSLKALAKRHAERLPELRQSVLDAGENLELGKKAKLIVPEALEVITSILQSGTKAEKAEAQSSLERLKADEAELDEAMAAAKSNLRAAKKNLRQRLKRGRELDKLLSETRLTKLPAGGQDVVEAFLVTYLNSAV